MLMEVTVDDQDHTAAWLRSGTVLAAVTGAPHPASGCNSLAAGGDALCGGSQSGVHGAPLHAAASVRPALPRRPA
ncbi:hypothetical protein LP420_00900 [Massilia sp. B-10]|nr:hypothetical protein LP420_00900 [Massilia sp. B-10]